MNSTAAINFITILLFVASASAGETDTRAISALFGSAGNTSVTKLAIPVSPPKSIDSVSARSARSWETEAKKTCKAYFESGKLFTLPKVKESQLPEAVRQQLKRANVHHISSTYKLVVKSRPAFVIHNGGGYRSTTIHILDAYGRLIAAGSAGKTAPLRWVDINSISEPYYPGNESDYPGHSTGPDGQNGGGPEDGTSGDQDSTGGGPDDSDDGGGCGGSGSDNGGNDGPDGSGGVYF